MRAAVAMAALACAAAGCGNRATRVDSPPPAGQAATGAPDIQVVNQPGEDVALERVLVPGKVTLVKFYADWCGACEKVMAELEPKIAAEPRIAVRKINIKDSYTPVAKHYGVEVLPQIRVFTVDGELYRILIGNSTRSAADIAINLLEGTAP